MCASIVSIFCNPILSTFQVTGTSFHQSEVRNRMHCGKQLSAPNALRFTSPGQLQTGATPL